MKSWQKELTIVDESECSSITRIESDDVTVNLRATAAEQVAVNSKLEAQIIRVARDMLMRMAGEAFCGRQFPISRACNILDKASRVSRELLSDTQLKFVNN